MTFPSDTIRRPGLRGPREMIVTRCASCVAGIDADFFDHDGNLKQQARKACGRGADGPHRLGEGRQMQGSRVMLIGTLLPLLGEPSCSAALRGMWPRV